MSLPDCYASAPPINSTVMPSLGTLRVGLAVGAGTGPELAAVFRRALSDLARDSGIDVAIELAGRRKRGRWRFTRSPRACVPATPRA